MSWGSQFLQLSLAICLALFASEVFAQKASLTENAAANTEQADQNADRQESNSDDYAAMSLEDLASHYSARFRAYSKRYRAAPTAAEKREVFKDLPNVKPYWPRLIALINKDPGSAAGLEVVDWWYRRGGRNEGSDTIVRLLTKHYSQKQSIKKYIPRITYHLSEDEAEESLRNLLKVSSFDSVKAAAVYELHQLLKTRAEGLEGESAEAVTAEVKSLRDLIFAKYATEANTQGAKYSELLEAMSFATNLEIGKPVPEIEGVDLDGVEFKLSDYDGKVIVISFWGDW